ncbi:hypothetical protein CEXT_208661 [Caerostris extrusa]|uniref:Uncharacterized protein n=1 Tax=Caerostris extrusa TaxID=172846 RepID=A0AAV4P9Q4_CAEEX|nr:hypothetical protein CEXT_208661 [Caerostris extrusa]
MKHRLPGESLSFVPLEKASAYGRRYIVDSNSPSERQCSERKCLSENPSTYGGRTTSKIANKFPTTRDNSKSTVVT